jgi:HEAT repeat protein
LLGACAEAEPGAGDTGADATQVARAAPAQPVAERRRSPPPAAAPQPVRPDAAPDASIWDALCASRSQARLAAVERIGGLGREVAEPALIRVSREAIDAEVREAALDALDGSESLDVARALVDALSDSSVWVQDAAEQGLYRWKDRTTALGAVATLCASDDRELRIRAAELLDEMVPDQLPWDEIAEGPVRFDWAPKSPFTGSK